MLEEEENKEFVQIRLKGKNAPLWERLRNKFLKKVEDLLDTVINFEDNTSIKDEAKQFSTDLIKFAKEKLRKAGYENEKLLAEVEDLYAKARKSNAETRKLNAEAREIELKNKLREIKLGLALMKALLTGEPDEESILFLKKIDAFLEVTREYELTQIR
jgi:hypothetical protein